MAKRTGPTNVHLRQLIVGLEKVAKANSATVWKDVAKALAKPRRQKVEVNLVDIDRYAEKGQTVVVPGTVLAKGDLTKEVTIAAWRFSPAAEEKIKKANGTILSIGELLEKNPNGKKVKIMV
jgi:large subunit ribosomal protein L18e